MTLAAAVLSLATSFAAWYIARHEHSVVYPFDDTYTAAAQTGETRLAEHVFHTADGERLVLWSAPPRPGRPVLLYLPGNAGTLAGRMPRFTWLLDRGYVVTTFAYRGSSGSSGRPDETALTADAEAVARAISPPPETLVIYGESLGSAIAVKLAAAGFGDAVVLESPFTSIADLVAVQFPGEDVAHLFHERWETRVTIAKVRQPLLVLHGTADRLVPLAQAEEVHSRAGSLDKALVVLEGAGHAAAWSAPGLAALDAFLATHRAAR